MTKEWPRILIGITTYKGKDYIIDKCYQSVRNLDYPSDCYDVLVVDNTNDNGRYASKLERRGIRRLAHVPRGANSREALTKSQNYIRKKFLEGNYDYLFLVESDLIIPKGQLKRLLSHDKPVVGSTYNISRTEGHFVPCIFLNDGRVGALGATRPLGITRDTKTGENLYTDFNEIREFMDRGGLQQCHGVGFGATLIHRSVVERFPFWCDERFAHKHSDVYFYLDLERAHIPVYVDTDIIVPHYPQDWDDVADR